MKALVIYLAGVVLVFGALALLISAPSEPKSVFVVVDSSFPMREVWGQVPDALDEIEAQDFATFALATEKDRIHSWQEQLAWGSTRAFAPCDFGEIEAYGEAAEADERVLITTSGSCPTDQLADWRVETLEP